jgi:hypothetical protein
VNITMSNSAKQRQFFNDALKVVRELGCEVAITNNKHFKAKISRNNKVGTWFVSTTPSSRFAAQRAAISDLKKLLKDIGALHEDQHLGQGMLHMMSINHRSSAESALDAIIQREQTMSLNLFKQLLSDAYPELTAENVSELLNIFEKILTSVVDERRSSSTVLQDWTVLNPEAHSNAACARNVLVSASDKSNRFQFGWENSYKLKDAMESLLNYYEMCKHTTKLGVLLTNVWRPGELSLYASAIDAFDSRGIQSVALMVSGKSVMPVCWPWK